ncbi:TerD family protein [Microbacteriaceae bacterium VKM Ac-2855]|nr:TerD family protein [Microbacteriaceae bacterium VKM Ac-2855]
MAVTLSKGGTISLTKEAGPRGLTAVSVGLGWDPSGDGLVDLDASAVVVDVNGRSLGDAYFVFYNNLQTPDSSVRHSGDVRDGEGDGPAGDGDDEKIFVDLMALPAAATAIAFVVSIDDAVARAQSFSQVPNAHIRVVNDFDGSELARFDLSSGAGHETALTFGEVYRDGSDWKFRAIGDGHPGGFVGILRSLGVDI